jgi:hypothetical protein
MTPSLSYFFYLQVKRLHRTIGDWGISPWLAYIGAPLLFTGGSVGLFSRTQYASWIYIAIATAVLVQLCGSTRLRFLQQVFDRSTYWRIRLLENILVIVPFMLFLLYRREVWFAGSLPAVAIAALPFRIGVAGTAVLPTPFFRHPFEFIVGFRSSFGVVLITYILLVVGVYVGNGNLSLATLPLMVFVCANYYAWSEPMLYVWVYRLAPQSFLGMKVKAAFRHLTLMLLPMVLAIGSFFPDYWRLVLAVSVAGYGYLALAVLAKYAAFPRGIGIPQGILMALSFVFPPLLLVSLPYFFRKAKNNIALIL